MAQPESRLRARCAMLLKSHLSPPCWFTAIEHGRQHRGTAEQRAREWQHLARQGVQRGIGDLLVLAPGYCCFIELKAGKNKQSDAQFAFQAVMAALGHGYAVVRSVEQLGEVLIDNGIGLAPGWRLAAQLHDAALDGEPPIRKRKKPFQSRALTWAADAAAREEAEILGPDGIAGLFDKKPARTAKPRAAKPTQRQVAAGNAASLFMVRGK